MELKEFTRLVEVIKKLRHPTEGCPWDLKQTHQSLLRFFIEETYEFVHAAEKEDFDNMEEELGDVLLQILLHAQLGEEKEKFKLESISKRIADKLIYRHPHVFSNPDGASITPEQVKDNWQILKKKEKEQAQKQHYEIDESFLRFPSLFGADKIGKKTKLFNFDWTTPDEVIEKVEEEWQEFKDEIHSLNKNPEQDLSHVREELGDLLFTVAQLARHLNFNPEEVLREANYKFIKRFKAIEDELRLEGKTVHESNPIEMEEIWTKIKKRNKGEAQ